MRPGRLPENHPAEQLAREMLRQSSSLKAPPVQPQAREETPPPTKPLPERWG